MDNIKDIVNQVIENISAKKSENRELLYTVWKGTLNKQELQHAKLQGEKNGTVFVVVDSPAWLYQMKMREGKILKELKKEIPEITQIRFRVGNV